LEKFAKANFAKNERFKLSPITTRHEEALKWFKSLSASLDGVMAKRRNLPYRSGLRDGMIKVKNIRTVECVVGGFRYGKNKREVGSLLLGLYDSDGLLHHVGFTSSIKREDKPALTKKLEKLIAEPGFTGRAPGGPSRWNPEGSGEWNPIKPVLVVEVSYSHFSGDRFRHGTRLLRWRPDKAPQQCTMDQVKASGRAGLALLKAR
jgi:ATP-dependent DNA ligase